ncbi:MAG: methanethiol S-methyltransferase [Hyphomicrobiales bacterium]
MNRILIFAYGVVSYLIFLATFLYAIGFIGNFAVPTTLDGAATMPFWQAFAINTGLLGLFAVQHSVMARPAFKRWWTQYVPAAAERSTYVLFSSLALIAMFVHWQPMGGIVWEITNPVGQGIIYALFALGWAIVLVATFLINHFDLFGLRQVWLNLTAKPYTPLKFGTPWLYRYVRHPLYVGWFLAFWATPTMTAAHLLFAVMTAAYILIAIRLEERDLVATLGDDYETYRKSVPMLVPRLDRYEHGRAQTA